MQDDDLEVVWDGRDNGTIWPTGEASAVVQPRPERLRTAKAEIRTPPPSSRLPRPTAAQWAHGETKGTNGGGRPTFSRRETQVRDALERGERVTDISADLNLSVKTVSTYKTRAIHKEEKVLRRKDVDREGRYHVKQLIRRYGLAFVLNVCALETKP